MKNKKSNRQKAEVHPSSSIRGWAFPLSAICLTIFIAYQHAFGNGFTNWDDPTYVYNNPLIRNLSFSGIKEIFSVFVSGNYHPLVILSFAVEYSLFGLKPAAYHSTNIILHIANSCLLFFILHKLTEEKLIAFIASFLFGIHPLHVESVAWVTERKDVLYTLFFFLSVFLYQKYQDKKNIKIYIAAVGMFILSCLSKGQAVILPVFLIAMEYYGNKQFNILQSIKEKLPFFVIAFLFGILALKAQSAQGNLRDAENYIFIDNVIIALNGFVFYIEKTILPLKLSAFYPYPEKEGNMLPAKNLILALFGVLLLAIAAWGSFRNRKIAASIGLFLVGILPVIQILPVGNAIYADRYFYVSSVGIFLLAGTGINYLFNHSFFNEISRKIMLGAVLLAYSIWMMYVAHEQTHKWSNSFTLWGDVAENYPNAAIAYNSLANAYLDRNNQHDAIRYFKLALEHDTKDPKTYNNLGNAYENVGLLDSAIANYLLAVEVRPLDAMAWTNLGTAYHKTGEHEKAEQAHLKSININPNPLNYSNLANTVQSLGRNDEAIELCQKAIALDSNYAMAFNNLGVALHFKGEKEEALKYFKKAARMGQPNSREYLKNIGVGW